MKLYKIWKGGEIVESPYPGLYVGVKTTKVFGRLTHKSGAKKENLVFFHAWADALKAGFGPCRGCKPVLRIEEESAIQKKEARNAKRN
ncbi:MAG: hypothetical protein UW81_C0038G0010 [Candidatus Giovannonibacteria bacterium GW2011_GWC2_44_9]|uniref:Ada DNA repair metal-binding domain-containing protein n=3 Tax=Candidatus Giovannoniibacteriota TaxID=1752738 RepID=A0A1F5WCB3_9BACT|nr:MAG: hypothetical protein UW53_C0013G0005 [Candidatus Giovannonibacteria bacterium GW2011_GWA1_44_25]KKT82618.1 MAG: hypothetical protein UW81_C0038G0010 [Candidatus Giovannonibacteria bacterium GW2011_GWC2_44_9]KKU29521.1 MAG: hypothetical protein UX43_C0010G0005 [Candidatus Giovannonibacteria bacterium GW2011_GWB1_46_20]OGF49098.1 MAG: hypothetical protein A2120_04745 [Candidatus Giovannonibacteria bacterium GWA2_45_15]OGF60490.1 MAG: hypothetical protein A2W40_03235 [Candidatus Giovannoni